MEPGFHILPDREYFAAAGVSNSDLREFERSPRHYLTHKKNVQKEPTADQQLGKYLHMAVLETDKFTKNVIAEPIDYDGRQKRWKQWRAERCEKEIITHEQAVKIYGMTMAILEHPTCKKIFSKGRAEICAFAEFVLGGRILRKCKMDWLPDHGNAIVDLKTTDDASPDGFAKSLANWKYYRQAAYYLDICKDLGMDREAFVFIVVEKEPPYAVALFNLDAEDIGIGRLSYIQLLQRFMECQEKNDWPAYPQTIQTIKMPDWARRKEAA